MGIKLFDDLYHMTTITNSNFSCTHVQEIVKVVNLTVLKAHQYCVVLDPIGGSGKPQFGCREVRTGHRTFFLHPGTCYMHVHTYTYIFNTCTK